MTTMNAPTPGLDASAIADLRFDHSMAAQRSEQANRPRIYVVLALVALIGCVLALLWSWSSYASARRALVAEQATAARAVELAGRLQALKLASVSDSGPRANEPVDRLLSRLESIGRDAGLKNGVPLPGRNRGLTQQGMVQVKLNYELRDISLGALLVWVERAMDEVPGLEVFSLSLRPESQQWVLKVQFSRWERAEGGG